MIILRQEFFSSKKKNRTSSTKVNGKDYIKGNLPEDYERGGDPKSIGEIITKVAERGKKLSEN